MMKLSHHFRALGKKRRKKKKKKAQEKKKHFRENFSNALTCFIRREKKSFPYGFQLLDSARNFAEFSSRSFSKEKKGMGGKSKGKIRRV